MRRVLANASLLVVLVASMLASARLPDPGPHRSSQDIPTLRPSPELGGLAGRRVSRIEVVVADAGPWQEPPTQVRRARAGEVLSLELARRAMRELTDSGRYARVWAEADVDGEGAVLRLIVVPRRLIANIKLVGGALGADDTLRAAGVREGGELTALELGPIAESFASSTSATGIRRR